MKTAYYYNRYQENEEIVILDSSRFETKRVCDCYDRYGQIIGCYNAGCYSVENSSCDLEDNLKSFLSEKFKIDFESFDFDDIEDVNIENEVKKWREENENHETALVFEYWNGSNWQTLFVNSNDISTNGIEALDKEESKKIVRAYNRANFINKGFGTSEYVGRKYIFTCTQFASDPFISHVELL